MATLGLKEMRKFLWEGSEEGRPVGCLSLAKLNRNSELGKFFSLPSQSSFPISFKPKVAMAKFIGKMQKKIWYSVSGLENLLRKVEGKFLACCLFDCSVLQ